MSGDFTFASRDGAQIHVYGWLPAAAPKATVQIAHGMAEHGARYQALAATLNDLGYAVYANDHRGHGRSIAKPDGLGHMGDDGFVRAIDDVHLLCEQIATRHQGVPHILMGHSMGSFMVQKHLWAHPDSVHAAILSSSSGAPPPIAAAGRVIARLERWRQGASGKSTIIDVLSFRDYNKKFSPNRTDFDWLSRDHGEVDLYVADPLCGFPVSNASWISLLDALPALTQPSNLAHIRRELPIYLFSGTSDPVGEMGNGLMRLVHAYHDAGLTNVAVKLYPGGRHEMLHETNRESVTQDLVSWLEAAFDELS